jgi:hypothetical protein
MLGEHARASRHEMHSLRVSGPRQWGIIYLLISARPAPRERRKASECGRARHNDHIGAKRTDRKDQKSRCTCDAEEGEPGVGVGEFAKSICDLGVMGRGRARCCCTATIIVDRVCPIQSGSGNGNESGDARGLENDAAAAAPLVDVVVGALVRPAARPVGRCLAGRADLGRARLLPRQLVSAGSLSKSELTF